MGGTSRGERVSSLLSRLRLLVCSPKLRFAKCPTPFVHDRLVTLHIVHRLYTSSIYAVIRTNLVGNGRLATAGDQVLSPAASVAAPKEPSSETQPVVDGELDSLYAVDREEPFSAAAAQTSNGINTVSGEQLMAASVRHKRPDLYQH